MQPQCKGQASDSMSLLQFSFNMMKFKKKFLRHRKKWRRQNTILLATVLR